MIKRLFDIVFSLLVLFFLSPVFIMVAILLKVSSNGPVFYIAKRAGFNGAPFDVFKFRSMHIGSDKQESISLPNDTRAFGFGSFLRKTKLDEIPQFINVLIGDMSVVGPRPEDINIVKKYYSEQEMKTLSVKPGIVSPGSIYNYTHSHLYLDDADVENSYIRKLLPVKLALEIIYIERMNFFYDLQLIWRTIVTIIKIMLGVKEFKDPIEYIIAKNRGIF